MGGIPGLGGGGLHGSGVAGGLGGVFAGGAHDGAQGADGYAALTICSAATVTST